MELYEDRELAGVTFSDIYWFVSPMNDDLVAANVTFRFMSRHGKDDGGPSVVVRVAIPREPALSHEETEKTLLESAYALVRRLSGLSLEDFVAVKEIPAEMISSILQKP